MKDISKTERGATLIRSVILSAIGLLSIALGFSFLPVIGIIIGAAFLWFALYPWINGLHLRKVKVLIGSVSDNNLGPRRIPVAILSSTKEKDGVDFDPGRINPSSIVFGPEKTRPVYDMSDPEIYARSTVDINGDGVPDLILYFSGDSAGITEEVEETCLYAKTREGERVLGCSAVDLSYESGLMEKLEYV